MSNLNNRRREGELTAAKNKPMATNKAATAVKTALVPMPGATVYPRNGAVNVRRDASVTSVILNKYPAGQKIGQFTGSIEKKVDGDWLKITVLGGYGWVRSDVVIVVNPTAKNPSQSDINDVVQKLQKSDEEIFHTLLRTLPKLQAAKAKGVNVAAHESKYQALYGRFSVRQKAMRQSTALKVQTGVRKTYEGLRDTFKSWLGIQGIGEPLSIGATCVVLVVLGAGAAAAVYFIFKPKYDESTKDLVISADLEKALSTLSPEARETVEKDLEKQVDDAYNQGKTDGTFGGMGQVLMYGGFALLGFFAIKKLSNK